MTEPRSTLPFEPQGDAPGFLQLGQVRIDGQSFEIASRKQLDTRAVVPWFERDGALHVGLCVRTRVSRALQGRPLVGWEAFAYDFRSAGETGDIAAIGEEQFSRRTGLTVDPTRAPIALPSFARSIGYLCELCLPLLLPIVPPDSSSIALSAPRDAFLIFLPLEQALAKLVAPDSPPHSEELELMLRALAAPRTRSQLELQRDPSLATLRRSASDVELAAGDRCLKTHAAQVVTAERMQPGHAATPAEHATSSSIARGDALQFLKLFQLDTIEETFEIVAPASCVSFALLPFVRTSSGPHFLLWDELRPSAIERQVRAPLFDLPVSLRHVNATAIFLPRDEANRVIANDLSHLEALAPGILARALGAPVPLRAFHLFGKPGEPAPAISAELRCACVVELDGSALAQIALPGSALLISAAELSRAIGEGRVRDPVVVNGFLLFADLLSDQGAAPLDPFAAARLGDPAQRAQFLSAMTHGSEVQRRLLGYSSIEAEQLAAPTYARLMTLLQHEHGLRIAYPKTEADRSFFKAAFRVFMAADRGDDDRALQGLHWSHDAFHFALGNFIVPAPPDFARWYASGEEAPAEQPAEGPAWDIYSRALKTAENEATFFSFWTLYAENFALAKHVGKLTYYEAVRDLGIIDRKTARAIYDDVVDRAVLPESVSANPVYQAREDIQGLFKYMLGFRPYHFKDIAVAWRYATRDPYRGYLARFEIYEHDLERYLANVHGFCDRLAAMPRGLNPILCAVAEARLDLALRVWDVTKALRILRAATLSKSAPTVGERDRAQFLEQAEPHLQKLEAVQHQLQLLRDSVQDAELTPRNEATLGKVSALANQIEVVRSEIWNWVDSTKLIAPDKLAAERVRELPR
jgi:hypothetical protein